ncbi:hypothetical protein HAX54_008008, partial [Datura stramonium]|nr:hypothetical protein [Datura stramonium]
RTEKRVWECWCAAAVGCFWRGQGREEKGLPLWCGGAVCFPAKVEERRDWWKRGESGGISGFSGVDDGE